MFPPSMHPAASCFSCLLLGPPPAPLPALLLTIYSSLSVRLLPPPLPVSFLASGCPRFTSVVHSTGAWPPTQ
eukprot:6333943-Pyramimonas_sp.AAC.1